MQLRLGLVLAVSLFGCRSEPVATEGSVAQASALAASPELRPISSGVRHLPARCEAVVWLNLAALSEHRELMTPLFGAIVPAGSQTEPAALAFQSFLSAARLDLRKDLSDFALCFLRPAGQGLDRETEFIAAIGGRFGADVLDHVRAHAPGQNKLMPAKVGSREALARDGRLLLLSEDGAVLLSSSRRLLEGSLSTSSASDAYELATEMDFSILIRLSGFGLSGLEAESPFAGILRHALRLELNGDLGRDRMVVSLEFASGADAISALQRLERLVTEFKAEAARDSPLLKPVLGPALAIVNSASWAAEGRTLVAQLRVSPAAVGWLIERLARAEKPKTTPRPAASADLGAKTQPLDVSRAKAKP